MARCKREKIAWLLGIVLLTTSFAYGAAAKRDLEGIRKKIDSEKNGLSQLQRKEGSILDSLGKIQAELESKNRELKRANAKFAAVAEELALKESQARFLNQSIASRLAIFDKRAVALYRWHKSASPEVIFNGETSWTALFLRQKYLQSALVFDRQLLVKLQEESVRQGALRDELAQAKQQLNQQQQALVGAKEAVRQEVEKKKLLLASVRREKSTHLKFLREMEAAAQRLEKVIEAISKRTVNKSRETLAPGSPGAGFESLRGKLEWPIPGRIIAPFGKFKHQEFNTEIFRQGIDIDASLGEEIKAVDKGTVVYADRFAGYGKMVIIDHGERYFTIYGHLAEIFKKTGDRVTRGEVLGTAGDSDSLAGSELYFEMRKDGHSVDPVPWFRKQ